MEHFNSHYENEDHPNYALSLADFFKTIVLPKFSLAENVKILDLGCGSKSLFEDFPSLKKDVDAVDFSEVAIKKALSLNSEINYQLKDITKDYSLESSLYDLVFDSHCLHCIEGQEDRETAFLNIKNSLKTDGIFCAEMMISPSGKETYLPHKYTPSAHTLEQELLSLGFKISYFMVVRDLVFYNENGECDLLRVVARK